LFNHSCNPNCGINNNMELITLTAIEKGAELTWDYSTSMMENSWTMPCDCGTEMCRGVIRDFNTLPLYLRRYYIQLKIVMPFIIKNMAEDDRKELYRDIIEMYR